MRKALTILACALALLAACEKPDNGNPSKPTPTPPTPPPTPAAPIVVAAGTDLKPTITSDGGDTKISFTAKESWTASVIETKSVDWISLDKTSGGAGDFTLTVTVKPNTTYDSRSAIVRLQSGTTTIDILFSQKQTDALIVAVSEIKVGEDGETIEIKVETNVSVSYKIESDGEGWISHVSTKALSSKVFTFQVAANDLSIAREGHIVISGGGFKHTVKISQAAKASILKISQTEFNFEPEGGEFNVEVTSNFEVSYNIEGYCTEWIQATTTKAEETSVLSFNVLPNASTEARDGAIIISAGGLTETVTVHQSGQTPSLSLSQTEFEVGPGESQIKVEVTSNVPVYIQTEDYWVWFIGNDLSAPYVYLFGIYRNNAYVSRSCNITFYNDEFGLKEVVTVTQKPSDVVEIYDSIFKEYCLGHFDTDGDGEISFEEAKAVKEIEYYAETLNLHGIDAFVNLETLKIGSGKSDISSARQCYIWEESSLASLTKLRHLECTYVCINNFDLSRMPDLEYLDVEATSISTLDVSYNKKLTYLDCAPSLYTLQNLLLSKDQSIPNVTTNRSSEYIPDNTIIYIDGIATGSGNEGTMEGGEI